jgi:hypothetical protein
VLRVGGVVVSLVLQQRVGTDAQATPFVGLNTGWETGLTDWGMWQALLSTQVHHQEEVISSIALGHMC